MTRRSPFWLAVPALTLTLAACGGGGSSDKDDLKKIINDANSNPVSVCDHLDAKLLTQLGGKAGCKKAAAGQPKNKGETKIQDLKVDGDKATATVTDKTGKTNLTFIKQGGEWKLTANTRS